MNGSKRAFITILSLISILFGLSGAVFSFGSIFVLNSYKESFDNINSLSLSITGTIEETSTMMDNSTETSSHIAESIRTSKNTIEYASDISYDSGMAFKEIADLIDFEILGYQPLDIAEGYFHDIGNNLIGLSEELDKAKGDLEINAEDLDRISFDLENISKELQDVSMGLDQATGSFNIYNLVSIIRYLLIYLGILNIMFILNGLMFLSLRRK